MSIDSVEQVEEVPEGSIDYEHAYDAVTGEPLLVMVIKGADVESGRPATIKAAFTVYELANHAKVLKDWTLRALIVKSLRATVTVRPQHAPALADALAALDAAEAELPELPAEDGCGS